MANTKNEPPRFSIRHFRASMARRVDDGQVVAITKHNRLVGYYVPADATVPHNDVGPAEPQDDDEGGPIVIGQVTASDPRWHELWRTAKLRLPQLFEDD